MKWSSAFEEVVRRHLPLLEGDIPPDTPLADLGLDSLATVSLVMELEDALAIAMPDEVLTAETFRTAKALWAAVSNQVEERVDS